MPTDLSPIQLTEQYAVQIQRLNAQIALLAQMLDGSGTNLPNPCYRLSSTAKRFEKWNGSAWLEAVDIWDINVSASKLLSQLLTVDGPGCGFDADKLDGKHANDFVLATAFTANAILALIKTVDGLGSGLDAELLQGMAPSAFAFPGEIAMNGANTAPSGWLRCNGAAVSRTTYSSLFAAVGTTWGAGNGSTTFNVPDLRGVFLRGFDDGRGLDAGRAFATLQSDAFKSHKHSVSHSESDWWPNGLDVSANNGAQDAIGDSGWVAGYTDSTGGSETRPINVSVGFVIKY